MIDGLHPKSDGLQPTNNGLHPCSGLNQTCRALLLGALFERDAVWLLREVEFTR